LLEEYLDKLEVLSVFSQLGKFVYAPK